MTGVMRRNRPSPSPTRARTPTPPAQGRKPATRSATPGPVILDAAANDVIWRRTPPAVTRLSPTINRSMITTTTRAKTPSAATAKTTTPTARSMKASARRVRCRRLQGPSRALRPRREAACTALAAGDELYGNEIDDDCDGQIDESPDDDKDGFSVCDGDCCDKAGTCGTAAELVNPGAFEVLGNGIDDDCDPSTDDVEAADLRAGRAQTRRPAPRRWRKRWSCAASRRPEPKSNARTWGVISAKFFAADHVSAAPSDVQSGVLSRLRSERDAAARRGDGRDLERHRARRERSGVRVASSTRLGQGQLGRAAGRRYLAAHGGMLPAADRLSRRPKANDSVALEMHVRVPTNAHSFSLRFKLFSPSTPSGICHDYFVALVTTNAAGVPGRSKHRVARGTA